MTKPQNSKVANAVAAQWARPAVTRIMVANFSGNTGKTTMVRHLLAPMFPGALQIRIETINDSGNSEVDIEYAGKQFDEVAKTLFGATQDIIVDIGASNIELVLKALRRLGDVQDEVDMWLIPVMPSGKQAKDTVATITAFLSIGVDASKITVLKNKVLDVDSMDRDYAALEHICATNGVRVIDTPVLELDVYSELDAKVGTIDQIVADTTDYKAVTLAAKATGDEDGALEAIEKEFRRKNAKQALKNLTAVRNELFGVIDAVAA